MKKLILFLFCLLVLIFTVSANENVFELNQDINYKFPCFINNTKCTACNVTVFDQANNIKVNGLAATNNGNYYSISISSSIVNTTGKWNIISVCNASTIQDIGIDYIYITPDGTKPTSAQGVIYSIVPLFGLIFIILLLFWLGFKMGDKFYFTNMDLKVYNFIRTFFIWIGLFLIPLLLSIITKIFSNLLSPESFLTKSFEVLWIVMAIVIATIFVISFLFFLLGLIVSALNKVIKRVR